MHKLDHHSHWRLDLARQICERLRRFDGIQAMIVGGSVARGYADAYSDLEIPIVWDALPSDDTRLAIASTLQAEFLMPYNGPAREDNLLIKGFQVDLWHNTVDADEEVIGKVLKGYSTDLGASNFMDTIRVCIPLMDEPIIARWKDLAAEYPPELAVRNIELVLNDFDLKQLDLAIQRDNPLLYFQTLSTIQSSLFMVLLALNHAYFPTLKWIYPTLQSFAIVPPQVGIRLRKLFEIPPDQAIDEILSLLLDTFDLIDQNYPQLDTTQSRQNLQLTRAAVNEAVQL